LNYLDSPVGSSLFNEFADQSAEGLRVLS